MTFGRRFPVKEYRVPVSLKFELVHLNVFILVHPVISTMFFCAKNISGNDRMSKKTNLNFIGNVKKEGLKATPPF